MFLAEDLHVDVFVVVFMEGCCAVAVTEPKVDCVGVLIFRLEYDQYERRLGHGGKGLRLCGWK